MKSSKIFLGVTTTLLAVAGIAATKAHNFTNKKTGYYSTVTGSNAKCTRAGAGHFYTSGSNQASTTFGTNSRILYTQSSSSTCSGNSLWKTDGVAD